ncbi:MAG: hypothetical protein ACE5GM_02815 [bacterium]
MLSLIFYTVNEMFKNWQTILMMLSVLVFALILTGCIPCFDIPCIPGI